MSESMPRTKLRFVTSLLPPTPRRLDMILARKKNVESVSLASAASARTTLIAYENLVASAAMMASWPRSSGIVTAGQGDVPGVLRALELPHAAVLERGEGDGLRAVAELAEGFDAVDLDEGEGAVRRGVVGSVVDGADEDTGPSAGVDGHESSLAGGYGRRPSRQMRASP
jgi:hypothetical protein